MTPRRRLVGNAAWLLTADAVNRAATFVLYMLIARHLGTAEVGRLVLAIALFYMFQVLAAAGVKTVITREVARDPASVTRHLAGGACLVTLASAKTLALLAGFVQAMDYAPETAGVVLMLGLALLPFGLSAVCEAVFQATERMRWIALAHLPVHVAKVGLAALLLHRGHGVHQVALLLLAGHVAIAVTEWGIVWRRVIRPPLDPAGRAWGRLRATIASALAMARAAVTFVGIDGLIAAGAGLNVVLLSAFLDEREVGLYGASAQLLVPVTLVFQSVVVSVFPMLCRTFAGDTAGVPRVLARMLAVLLALAIPTAVGLCFLADGVLLLLYGDPAFLEGSVVLRVAAWGLVPAALTSVLGQVFLAGSRETVTLRIVAVNLVVALVAGVVLIGRFGLVGAAMASLATKIVNVWQHYRPAVRLAPGLSLVAAAWQPALAGACMAAALALAGDRTPAAVSVPAAGALYLAVLASLTLWTHGGSRQLRPPVTWPASRTESRP